MTAPTTSATPKIALDQRASSRHDSAGSEVRKRPQFFVKLRLQGRCSVLVPDPLVASKCADAV